MLRARRRGTTGVTNGEHGGFVDAMDTDRIWGWAWDATLPDEPIDVDLYVDGRLARSVRADQLGADLLASGVGDGCHRWSCALADLVHDDRLHEISARFGGTATDLGRSPRRYLRGALELIGDLEPQAIVASLFLRGQGIEIGVLNNPLPVPTCADVRYVDRLSPEALRAEYPETRDLDLVDIDIVTDGETLAGVDDVSQDFVIANNFLEHCEDPIATLKNFLRVLRPGGIAFLVIPNRRGNIDVGRPETSVDHFVRDHEEGPQTSRHDHYLEWTQVILGVDDDAEVERQATALERDRLQHPLPRVHRVRGVGAAHGAAAALRAAVHDRADRQQPAPRDGGGGAQGVSRGTAVRPVALSRPPSVPRAT